MSALGFVILHFSKQMLCNYVVICFVMVATLTLLPFLCVIAFVCQQSKPSKGQIQYVEVISGASSAPKYQKELI